MEHMGLGVFCMKFDFSYHMLLIFVDLPKQTDVCFKTVFPMKNHAVYMYRIKTCLPRYPNPTVGTFLPKIPVTTRMTLPGKHIGTIFFKGNWIAGSGGFQLMEA